jgi:hypothetical protein
VFTEAANKFNAENGYTPSDPEYVTPGFLKAWAMVESGGDQGCFGTDPFQVNNPGDWNSKKKEVAGLIVRFIQIAG